jgi:hypothetical protein
VCILCLICNVIKHKNIKKYIEKRKKEKEKQKKQVQLPHLIEKTESASFG